MVVKCLGNLWEGEESILRKVLCFAYEDTECFPELTYTE